MSALLPFPPPLELSDEELARWFYYDDRDALGRTRLGVKLRGYPVELRASYNEPTITTVSAVRVQMADLRSRLIGLTFSGDMEFFQIAVTRNSTEYLVGGGQAATFVHVQTLTGNTPAITYNSGTISPTTSAALVATAARANGRPFLFDPTPLLAGSDELVISGQPVNAYTAGANVYYLNVVVWAWGFPNDGQRPPTPRGV